MATGTEEKLSTTAIAIMIDDLRSEDPKKRLNSIRNLTVIAQALGPEKVRSELLPFLAEFSDDDDEILVTLATSLGAFVDLVGGSANVLVILKALEPLVCAEESIVRDKAIESLKKVLASSRIKEREGEVMDLIKRLQKDSESFTGRIAAASIIPVCFPSVSSSSQQDLAL